MTDVTQIRVGKNRIGIIGLKAALSEVAETSPSMSDEEIGSLLLEKLSQKNYIIADLEETYTHSFLREYKKHVGEPVAESLSDTIQIKILGAGCIRCERLERDVMVVLSETGILAELDSVRDLAEIGSYGVMGTPALVINGDVKAVGKVPSRSRLKTWIEEAVEQIKEHSKSES